MIRSAFLRPLSSVTQSNVTSRRALIVFHSTSSSSIKQSFSPSCLSTLSKSSFASSQFVTALQLPRSNIRTQSRQLIARAASSSSSSSTDKNQSTSSSQQQQQQASGQETEPPTSQEIVLTPGEKVVVGTRLAFWAAALSFASVCAYYIAKELLPTKMSPNTIFDRATDTIRKNDEINKRFGPFKTYGRDHGGHREGRRNFIEHTEYTDENDGSKRTRVRFNLEGAYGTAFVFAEVSKEMESGEFVYILVQDKRNGQVITVVDNRSRILAERLGGGSKEGKDVFGALLGGGKK
jgi:import inner membrane translocase subunit TIM21